MSQRKPNRKPVKHRPTRQKRRASEEGQELMLPPETERLIAARHEAYHTVVAHALGVPVRRVTVDTAEARRDTPDFDATTGHDFGTWEENATISVAGQIADQRAAEAFKDKGIRLVPDVDEGTHHDLAAAIYFARQVVGNDKDAGLAWLTARFDKAGEILYARWDDVLKLAEALRYRIALDEPEILEILGPYPEVDATTQEERGRVSKSLIPLAKSGES